jgi:hypothetical protein
MAGSANTIQKVGGKRGAGLMGILRLKKPANYAWIAKTLIFLVKNANNWGRKNVSDISQAWKKRPMPALRCKTEFRRQYC